MLSYYHQFLQHHVGRRPPQAEPVTPGRPLRVLLVEDDADFIRILAIALRLHGFEVSLALNGSEALDEIAERHVDLIVLDYYLTDIGADVVHSIAVSWQPHLARQSVIMTGAITDDPVRFAEKHDTPLLRKPFDLWVMIDTLHMIAPKPAFAARTA